ncbi:diguanylate cyclase [Thiohalophilus sp.]|uniref:diguanylate cyclase n=1 Tax=Thiohalophilus sp. TaxID=3028392 RepID=UPI0039761E86
MILSTGLMLLPLLLLGAGGYALYLQTISSFETAMQRSMQVVLPVSELQRQILEIDRPLDQYLYNTREQEREAFFRHAQAIDRQFVELLDKSALRDDYRPEIARSSQSWQQLRNLADRIMQRHAEAGDVSQEMLVRFENLQRDTTGILDMLYQTFELEIEQELDRALRDQKQIQLLLLVIFVTGLGVAILIGNRIARQVLQPLAKLREGTERFGHGDLTYRIELDNQDEFGKLAKTFNEMADELEFLASYDSLTGLLNKREFGLRLQDEVRRAKRSRHPFVLLLMDLDYFKQVNDTYGHPAGDHTLRVLASLLKKQVRESDYVGRYGGEEFGMILTDTSEQDALDTAERIRQLVEEKAFAISDNAAINITVSAGLASYPDDATNAEMLIACADEALYKAKDTGRNRVIAFSDI